MKRLPIQTREFGPVPIPPSRSAARLERRLLRSTADLPFDVFTVNRRGLRADAVVGILDIGDTVVEILPKVKTGSTLEDDRQLLIDLLAFAEVLPQLAIRTGRVALGSDSLLEVVIRAAAVELAKLLRRGLPRRYTPVEAESSVIRGQIDFTRLARRGPWEQDRVPIRYAPLQRDSPLGRVIRALVAVLENRTRSAKTAAILRDCSTMLADVRLLPLTRPLVERVRLSRFEQEWEPVLELASALAVGRFPTPVAAGSASQFTLLFPLDDLFEQTVRRSLRTALPNHGLALEHGRPRERLLRAVPGGEEVISLKPDLLVVDALSRAPVLVADAKWKRLVERRTYGVRPGDVYQVATYMTRHHVSRGMLLYPITEWMRDEANPWEAGFEFTGSGASLTLLGADVAALVSRSTTVRDAAHAALAAAVAARVP